jgi:hypothetical protein
MPANEEILDAHNSDAAPDATAARPTTRRVHPWIYTGVIGFAAWFAFAVWGFAGSGVTDYLLAIVCGFIVMAVALPRIIVREWRKYRPAGEGADAPLSFRDWAAADFCIWDGRLRGAQAAILIALPIAAAAIGMTAFAIVFHAAERSAPAAVYSSGSVVKNSG